MNMAHVYDIAILGATPAGLAAAHYLASRKRDVVVMDSPKEASECPLADWVIAEFFKIPHLPKGLAKSVSSVPFSTVTYHNSTFDKQAEHHSRKVLGYLVQHEDLRKALSASAAKAGARIRHSTTSPAIRLDEDAVTLIGSVQLNARMLIVAHNRPESVISELSLPVRNVPQSPLMAAALELPAGAKAGKAIADGLHVVQSPQRGEMGLFFKNEDVVHIRIIRTQEAAARHVAELSSMLGAIQKAGLLPPDVDFRKAKGAVWHPPAGVALELETHVAKRCLLTGTAGGFADSITGATLMPTVTSAILAAEVADEALSAGDIQDAMMQYKSHWRSTLADHLRPPNTALNMLMPLLFVNNRIVAKFTEAMLHGQSI